MFKNILRIGRSQIKIIELAILLGLIFTVGFTLMGFNYECEQISNSILRLHIIANSDSDEDQALKLAVRDRIIENSKNMIGDSFNLNDAEKAVSNRVSEIEKIASQVIAEQGYSYPVKAELVNMHFNTRQYENVTLPAGNYDALRVTIGSGSGRNWWCVMFPPMCLPAAEEDKELSQVLDSNQLEIVQGGKKYELKFKIVELLKNS